jgi:negative regulator of flagellin synthesis FlgM
MQISGSGRSDQLAKILLGTQETKGPSTQRQPSQKEAGNDRVQISDQAKELQRIRALGQTPDQQRAARVDQIKNVSGRKVGDALIKQVLTDAVL